MNRPPKKRVFISYAHLDNRENFVARLGYALDMYVDTFWDIKLQAGSWDRQLIKKIEECDSFVVIMSHRQKEKSEWCKKELNLAKDLKKQIIPIHRFENHHDETLQSLQYADFSLSFDKGFRKLTELITGVAFTSWEYLINYDDEILFKSLAYGYLPALIANEFAEWLIVYQFWPALRAEIDDSFYFILPDPHTATDVQRAIDYLWKQITNESAPARNFIALGLIEENRKIIDSFIEQHLAIAENDHLKTGINTIALLKNINEFLEQLAAMSRDAKSLLNHQYTYSFDTASKLRELIASHARRSRYLY